MKLRIRDIRLSQIGLSNLYTISLVITMIILLMHSGELMKQTSLFDKASLEGMKGTLINGNERFLMIVKDRAAIILTLFLMATTSLGSAFVYMNVTWYGVSSGMLLTIALLRHGLKGILLLMAGMFPHYLIYVPAIVLTLHLTKGKRTVNGKFCMQLLVILFVVITGCFVECYVNPNIVAKMLKKF